MTLLLKVYKTILKLKRTNKTPHFDIYTARIFENKANFPETFDLFDDASALAFVTNEAVLLPHPKP